MKKSKLISFIFLILTTMSFVSCDNEPVDNMIDLTEFGDDNNGSNNEDETVFKVDFSGSTWVADEAEAVKYTNSFQIGGIKNSTGQTFAFSLNGSTPGTYDSTSNLIIYEPNSNNPTGDFYWALNTTNPSISAGTVTITNIDIVNNKVSGVFAFTGHWSDPTVTNISPIQFTNGVFNNIPFTVETNPTNDTFYAKVDGTEFVEDQIDVSVVSASGFPQSYSIVGAKANGETIGFRIATYLGVGTYNFTGPFGQDLSGTCVINNLLYTTNTGSLTITEKTATRIKGTFNYVASNFTTSQTKSITQGSFDVELP
jgi:hypothetical protein